MFLKIPFLFNYLVFLLSYSFFEGYEINSFVSLILFSVILLIFILSLLKKRFSWMNDFILEHHVGIEVGSGAGFSKDFISNKNFKLTDLGTDDHLDFKNIDAQDTGFKEESFDYVIASNMIHHIPFPIKFFNNPVGPTSAPTESSLAL